MFVTEDEYRAVDLGDPEWKEWRVVQTLLLHPWFVAQVLADEVSDAIGDVMIDNPQTLMALVQDQRLGTVLDVHMVVPPPYPDNGAMSLVRIERIECTVALEELAEPTAVLTCANGRRYGKHLQLLDGEDELGELKLLKCFPDLGKLNEVFGFPDEESIDPNR